MMETRTSGIDETERLRAEVDTLRARNSELEKAVAEGGGPPRSRWRWPTAGVLLVIACVLLAVSVVSVWAARTILDTDRYVETVTPLVDQPAIRTSLADDAVNELFTRVDAEARIRDALPPKAAFLATPLTTELRSVGIDGAEAALASPQFRSLWVQANRKSHEAIVPALLGEKSSTLVDVDDGTVSIDISRIVSGLKTALEDRGVSIVAQVPDDIAGTEYELFQSDSLAQVQSGLQLLRSLSIWTPVLTLLAFVGAIALAPDRRKAALWAGIGALLAMVALAGLLAFVRSEYLGSTDRLVLSAPAATAFFDLMVRFLRNALRTVAALGLVIALGAALAGPSRAASALRRTTTDGMGSLTQATGLDLGRFSEWVDRHRRGLEAFAIVVAAAVLLAVQTASPALVLWLAAAALIWFGVVELLARAHQGPEMYRRRTSA